jgi:sigma-E factor negative regulatory protein RseC
METMSGHGVDQDRNAAMVCQPGRVVRLEGEIAYVRFEVPLGCAVCASKEMCGALSAGGKLIGVRNTVHAEVGQRVELSLRPSAVVTASFLLFIVPVVAFLAGIIGGYALADQFGWQAKEWVGLVIGAAGFAAAFLVIRMLNARFERSGKYEPVITRVIA